MFRAVAWRLASDAVLAELFILPSKTAVRHYKTHRLFHSLHCSMFIVVLSFVLVSCELVALAHIFFAVIYSTPSSTLSKQPKRTVTIKLSQIDAGRLPAPPTWWGRERSRSSSRRGRCTPRRRCPARCVRGPHGCTATPSRRSSGRRPSSGARRRRTGGGRRPTARSSRRHVARRPRRSETSSSRRLATDDRRGTARSSTGPCTVLWTGSM